MKNDNDKFRQILLKDRYLLKSEDSWEDLSERVAKFLSDIEYEKTDDHKHKYAEYKNMLLRKKFIPSSPTLMASGTPYPMLSSCFVLPIEDSLESIMETVKISTLVNARGGGLGYDFSKIRPEGSKVKSTEKAAMGPLGAIRILDAMTDEIKQSGRRRGANMGVLSIHHPDIEKFITCKSKDGDISNFNLSVMVDDEFIERIKYEEPQALDLWNKITEHSWMNGEPGILFYNNINDKSPFKGLGIEITATNPCGEIPAPSWTSCNLGSINLGLLVQDGKFNKREYRHTIKIAYEMLNDVLDHNELPHEQLRNFAAKYRPIGLGIMGFHDALIKLGMIYGDTESFDFAEYVARTLYEETERLKPKYGNVIARSIAPTGSISVLADFCSWGIEPIMSYELDRKYIDNIGNKYNFHLVNPLWIDHKIKGIYRPEAFIIAKNVSPEKHIKMQAIFQKYVDSGISKTILLPNEASLEYTRRIYLEAHKLGCKGITIYRDMSREGQVYRSSDLTNLEATDEIKTTDASLESRNPNSGEIKSQETPMAVEDKRGFIEGKIIKKAVKKTRPKRLPGYTYKCRSAEGSFYITITHQDSTAFELFATPNIDNREDPNRGRESMVNIEALTRIISLALRSGVDGGKIIEQLERTKNQSLLSMPLQIANILKEYEDIEIIKCFPELKRSANGRLCPDCKVNLIFVGDCLECPECGWSKCGG